MDSSQAEDANENLPDWCNRITIKNTFLDVDGDGTEEEGVNTSTRRLRSAPPQMYKGAFTVEDNGQDATAQAEAAAAMKAAPLWVAARRAVLRGRYVQRCQPSRRHSGSCSSHGSRGSHCSRSGKHRGSAKSIRSDHSNRSSRSSQCFRGGMCSRRSSTSTSRSSCRATSSAGQSERGVSAVSRGTPPVAHWSELGTSEPNACLQSIQEIVQPEVEAPPEPSKAALPGRVTDHGRGVKTTNRFRDLLSESEGDEQGCEQECDPSSSSSQPHQSIQYAASAPRAGTQASQKRRPRQAKRQLSREAKVKTLTAMECPRTRRKGEGKGKPSPQSTSKSDTQTQKPNDVPDAAHDTAAASSDGRALLSDEKAFMLAEVTAKLHEKAIVKLMRDRPSHRLQLAVPVEACAPEVEDMLDIMLGMVLQCEAVDGAGLAFGTVLAPASRAGKRGCFRCDRVHPLTAELRINHLGSSIEYAQTPWDRLMQSNDGVQGRLRQKALQARLRAARAMLARSSRG